MASDESNLSNEELMHVALHANSAGRTQETMEALKLILSRDADNAKALYMLGAVHAEIGMMDDAVAEMARAVELEPELVTAHFQLGLLHFMQERYEEAARAWAPLDASPPDDAFYLFKTGLLLLAAGEYASSIETLESGIARNEFNEALNDDIRGIVDRIRGQMRNLGISEAENEQEAAQTLATRAVRTSGLSVYQRDGSNWED